VNVLVDTYRAGRLETSCVVDHDNPKHRQWMGRHCFWAFRNGREVRTKATDLPVTFVEREKEEA
jgi:hypothetical protein